MAAARVMMRPTRQSRSIGGALRDVVFDQHYFDLRHLARTENFVILQVRVEHVARIAIHDALFEERIRNALQDAAVDLTDHTG